MTLRELVEEAQKLLAARPELAEASVETEGCDCIGPASALSVMAHGPADECIVIVGRQEGK